MKPSDGCRVDGVLVSQVADEMASRRFDLLGNRIRAGSGFWIETPIGPIRTDIGYRLTDYEKSQPNWVFHFSIGPAF